MRVVETLPNELFLHRVLSCHTAQLCERVGFREWSRQPEWRLLADVAWYHGIHHLIQCGVAERLQHVMDVVFAGSDVSHRESFGVVVNHGDVSCVEVFL